MNWQGIVHGLDLLKKGVIWRVVDGKNVNIWRDNWLPRNSGLRVLVKKNRTRLKWVSELFISGTRRWDENLIRHLFYNHDAEEILRLHIQTIGEGDLIAWHYEKNGMFSVKSAYRLALNFQDGKGETGSSIYAADKGRSVWDVI